MPADDDGTLGTAERARLEAVAYGADSTPEDAAAARAALAGSDGSRTRQSDRTRQPDRTHPRDRTRPPDRADQADRPGQAHRAGQPDQPAGRDPLDDAAPTSTTPEPEPVGGQGSRVPPVVRGVLRRVRDRRTLIGAALVVTVVAAFGIGVGVGSLGGQDQRAAAASASAAAAGSVTLGEYLAAPQTFADQLPGQIIAPVRLHSTRLVFTNRSLSADDSQTPWDVYAAIGNDDDVVCLIATADGRTSSQSCFARQEALSGTVVLVAQSASGILAVRVSAGVVSGRVAPTP
ncbi:hypothetical protein [Curtobacterium sp. Leaf261]|uniref:hypothetical protein n=1 Tax=Curtobacterium sp. Leaf261 TaxID=1736311 RepID=UPI0006F6B760|nr:hypothetical protein [Curtobacterium sp. Leaf261]KQO64864.1 hypothetical protein ASF23_01390 [Curtobacterium sp. Leaf261]